MTQWHIYSYTVKWQCHKQSLHSSDKGDKHVHFIRKPL